MKNDMDYDWLQSKRILQESLVSRNLKDPNIRLRTIDKIESYLKSIGQSEDLFDLIKEYDKDDLKIKLTSVK